MARTRETILRSAAIHLTPIVTAALILRVPATRSTPFNALAWGLYMTASYAGWGVFLDRYLLRAARLDWGLRCGLGMAFVAVITGGYLSLLHIASLPVMVAVTVLGALFLANEIERQDPNAQLRKPSLDQLLFGLAAGALLVALFMHTMTWAVGMSGNGNDDPTYHFLAKDLLARGTSYQPFSFRRLCAYGAHEALLAQFIVAGVPAPYLNMFDQGLCPLILALVVLGAAPAVEKRWRPLVLFAASYILFVRVVQMNIASQGSTLVMVVVTYRAFMSPALRSRSLRNAVGLALPIVALCALKNSNVVPAAVFTLTAIAAQLREASEPRAARYRRAGALASAIVVLLLPFVIMSQRTGGSPLFPLVLGNYTRDYGFLSLTRPTFAEAARAFANDVVGDRTGLQTTWMVAALAIFFVEDSAALIGLVLATFGVLATLALTAPHAHIRDVIRYAYGFQHGLTIAACLHLAGSRASLRARSGLAAAVVISTALQGWNLWHTTGASLLTWRELRDYAKRHPDGTLEFTQLQEKMADGAMALVVVEGINNFDPRRQQLVTIDIPECVTPPPHTSAAAGVDSWAAYLSALGIRYLVMMKPDYPRDFYRRSTYELQLGRRQYESHARHVIAVIDAIDELAKSRAIAGETSSMLAIDLTQPRR